jgi:exopolysaccharide biosynthesis polyprenyl glycosylphosphotransferase
MLKEHTTILRKVLIVLNLCVVTVSFFLGYAVWGKFQSLFPLKDYAVHLPILLLIWGGLLYSLGMYSSVRVKKVAEILFILLRTAIYGFVVFTCYLYIFKMEYVSRAFVLVTFVFAFILMGVEKTAMILFFRLTRKQGLNFRSVLLIGTGRRAQHFIKLLRVHPEWGLKVTGLVDEDASRTGRTIGGCRVLGSFKDIPDIIHNNIVDEVVFVVPRSWISRIEKIINFCETEGLKVSVAIDYFNLKFARAKQSYIGEFPMLSFESTPDKLWQLFMKRFSDVVLCGAGLLLLAPLLAPIAATIKISSKGPVFFKQERCSSSGRRFTLFKFRTMIDGAEARLEELREQNEMNGPAFKMKNDPRVTGIGEFLRKFSLDELPQLWNVFMGDMSLVGPRPPLPKEVDVYDDWQRRRLSMRPGITCLWQANGRNGIDDFDEWARLDLEYIDNWSLWLDIKILFKTVPAVLLARGAK